MQSISRHLATTEPAASIGKVRVMDIAGPFVLLAIETVLLTPQVEFESGWMLHLASPAVFNALYFAAALLMLISASDLLTIQVVNTWRRRIVWLVANLVLFYAFYRYTLALEDGIRLEVVRLWEAAGWLLLAIAVGVSAWSAFIPLGALKQWLVASSHKVFASIVIAVTFAMLTPGIQSIWRRLHRPTIAMTEYLLHFMGHERLVSGMRGPNPILGTGGRGSSLEITPFCAEQESLAAFLLIGGILMIANWPHVRKLRMLVVIVCGLVCLHLFNAVRIYHLVEIAGTFEKPQLAVSIAHSRLGGILFLGISIFIFLASRRWWYASDSSAVASTVAS